MTPVILTAGDLTVHVLTWGAIVQDVRLRGVDERLTVSRRHVAGLRRVLQNL